MINPQNGEAYNNWGRCYYQNFVGTLLSVMLRVCLINRNKSKFYWGLTKFIIKEVYIVFQHLW